MSTGAVILCVPVAGRRRAARAAKRDASRPTLDGHCDSTSTKEIIEGQFGNATQRPVALLLIGSSRVIARSFGTSGAGAPAPSGTRLRTDV